MPRAARTQSKSQVYHVMLRGNNRHDIFLDTDDKSRMIDTILDKKSGGTFEVYAFCIMDNHMHIVIKEGKDYYIKVNKKNCYKLCLLF